MINKEREIQRQVNQFIAYVHFFCGSKKVGEYTKKVIDKFPLIKEAKSKHFWHRIK